MKKSFVYTFILISIIFLFSSCSNNNQQSDVDQSIIEYTVQKTNIVDTITVYGTVEAEDSAEVKALVSGVVEKVYVEEGDGVKAGDVLVELDDSDYRLTYIKALQDYETAKNSGSKLLIEQRQLELEIAKRDLERCKITSLVDGVVTSLSVKVGDYVSKGTTVDVVAKVVNVNNLYISAAVEEMDYSKVKIGQTAIVSFDAFENVSFPAKVTYIGSEAQTSSGIVTIPIKLSLVTPSETSPNYAKIKEAMEKIIPGLSCEAEIVVLNKTSVITVPSAAISFEDGKAYVTVKNGTSTEKRQITVGDKLSSSYEVLDGLKEGETIVVNKSSSSSNSNNRNMGIFMGGPAPRP
ncbi:efflux RND transporter periplasmic adaptor subunit [Pseudothermotoga elfii]|uniref:efflux RND transporter periplasmic adaptor subunit n=1 Tax=Pseudothermotoga elfii TaxID=38322 RepID=UPI0004130494|nr:efflux RND transporter periplasmic adaptor subunit [Pseudothermotoga elfii]